MNTPSARFGFSQECRLVSLNDVCVQDRCIVSQTARDLPYLSLEHIESNTGRILHTADNANRDEGTSTTFRFDSRHVLYGKLRPYLNKVALPDYCGRCTTELIPLLPNDQVTREFLALLLRRGVTVATAMKVKTGSRMPRADMTALMALEITLPPLPAQRRIAAQLKEQLAEVDRARTALQAQLDAAKSLPAATLRVIFGKETSNYLSSGVGKSSSNSRWSRLEEVCALLPSRSIQSHGDAIVKAVTSGCLTETGFDVKGLKVARMALAQVRDCTVSKGEILVARSNTPELVGRVALFNGEVEDIVASDLTIRLWPHERIAGEFLAAFLSFLFVSKYWRERASGASGTMKKITRSQIQQLLVPTPPLSTQNAIVNRLRSEISEAARLRTALESKLATLDRLPSALLRQVFGEVSSRED